MGVQVELREGVAVLRLAHGRANAIDLELCDALLAAADEVEASASAAVLTAEGGIFSAGVDLFRLLEDPRGYLPRFLPRLSEAFRRLALLEVPLVAAVNGHAIAGGFILLAAADQAVMVSGTQARAGVTELLVGVPFPPVAFELLRLRAGSQAPRMAMLGPTFGAEEALRLGLVDELAPAERLLPRAVELARTLAAAGSAFSVTKRQLRQPLLDALDRHELEYDQVVNATWSSPAALEKIGRYAAGIRANVSRVKAEEDA